MKIFINDSELNFTLENEKNLKEIVDSINDWLFTDNKIIDQIIIDDEIYNGSIEDLENYLIKDVKILKLTAIEIDTLVRSSLLEIKRYLLEVIHIIENLKEFKTEDTEKLINGMEWVINILERSNNLYNYENKINKKDLNFAEELRTLKDAITFLKELLKKEENDEINNFIKNDIKKIIEKWSKNIDILVEKSKGRFDNINIARNKVTEQIYKIINKIPDILKMIEVIYNDLQIGNEKHAMENMQILIETLESIISLLQLIKTTFSLNYKNIIYDDKSVEEYNIELTGILKELLEAMESNDTVLISDLIEYELSPRLEKYREVLKIISKEINIVIN